MKAKGVTQNDIEKKLFWKDNRDWRRSRWILRLQVEERASGNRQKG
jgi:hypothetical protein